MSVPRTPLAPTRVSSFPQTNKNATAISSKQTPAKSSRTQPISQAQAKNGNLTTSQLRRMTTVGEGDHFPKPGKMTIDQPSNTDNDTVKEKNTPTRTTKVNEKLPSTMTIKGKQGPKSDDNTSKADQLSANGNMSPKLPDIGSNKNAPSSTPTKSDTKGLASPPLALSQNNTASRPLQKETIVKKQTSKKIVKDKDSFHSLLTLDESKRTSLNANQSTLETSSTISAPHSSTSTNTPSSAVKVKPPIHSGTVTKNRSTPNNSETQTDNVGSTKALAASVNKKIDKANKDKLKTDISPQTTPLIAGQVSSPQSPGPKETTGNGSDASLRQTQTDSRQLQTNAQSTEAEVRHPQSDGNQQQAIIREAQTDALQPQADARQPPSPSQQPQCDAYGLPAPQSASILDKSIQPDIVVRGDVKVFVVCGSMVDLGPDIRALSCVLGGRLAKSLRKAMGEREYDKQLTRDNVRPDQLLSIKGARHLAGKFILHINISAKQYEYDVRYRAVFSSVIQSVLTFANKLADSLAMPILCPGQTRQTDIIKRVAGDLMSEIDQFVAVGHNSRLQNIYIVDTDANVINAVKKELRRLNHGDQMPLDQRGQPSDARRRGDIGCGDESIPREYNKLALTMTAFDGWKIHKPMPEISNKTNIGKPAKLLPDATDPCPICLDKYADPQALPCGHILCKECLESLRQHKKQCPECNVPFGIITGDQPPGSMSYRTVKDALPGYEGYGMIQIHYHIPSGKQGKEHPSPDKPYKGTERLAFLPDTTHGRRVLQLLRRAFDRRLIFTIGESRTTGKEGVVTWNDIHHKTRQSGGPTRFGYPDPSYLDRVEEELAAKGVTEDTNDRTAVARCGLE